MNRELKAITLMELLISIIIVSIIILGLGSIDLFSRHHVLSSERRAKLQNEVSHALEHMTKTISGSSFFAGQTRSGAIGDISPQNLAIRTGCIGGEPGSICITIDSNPPNSRRDASDIEIAYHYIPAEHAIWYYPNFTQQPGTHETIISQYVMPDFTSIGSGSFTQSSQIRYSTANNFLELQLTGCWDPLNADPNNPTANNPCVTMQTSIKLPGVSIN